MKTDIQDLDNYIDEKIDNEIVQEIENQKSNKHTITQLLTNRLLWVTISINVVVVLMIASTVSTIMRELESEHLDEIVDNMSNNVVATIEKYIQFAEVIAKNTAIIELMKESDFDNPMHTHPNKDTVVSELQFIAQNFEGDVINFGLLDLDQDGFLTQTGEHSGDDFSFKKRPYYAVVETKAPYVTSPYLDLVTGSMVVSVVTPLFSEKGEVLGAILIDLTTDFLSDLIIASKYGETGSGLIVDDNNIILAYENHSYIGQNFTSLSIQNTLLDEEIKNPTQRLIEYTIDDVQKIGVVGEIENYGWRVLTFMNLSEFHQYSNMIVRILIFLQIITTAITVIIASKTVKFSLEPLTDIKLAMQELARGNTVFDLEYTSNNEIGDLADCVRFAGVQLSEYIYKIKYQLDYDELTLLYSERKFIEETKKLLKTNYTEVYTILVVDIDNFKYVNDTFGYQKGSKLLQNFGSYFKENINGRIPVSRSNADTFLFLLTEELLAEFKRDKDKIYDDLSKIAVKAIDVKKANSDIDSHYDLSLSLGLYVIENNNIDVSSMIDCAVYAKNKGKSTIGVSIKYYGEHMNDERTANNYVVSKMREGAKNKEFVIYYQPKINLATNKVAGAEALVRWEIDGKLITPNKFIPVFETNGFIETLDYYTIDATCSFIKENKDINLPLISINLSGVTIMKKDVVSKILSIVELHDLHPEQIELEITESAFVNSFDVAMEKIVQFRKLGFSISMDDFGCGVSSLGRLKDMPIDVLKIDREFIIDSFKNDKADLILKNMVQMSKDLNLKTVVEGIETKDQLKFITELGCDLGQGYIFSRPVPAADFLIMLNNFRLKELDEINAELNGIKPSDIIDV